jgi:undecaprenyl-diphosphatase
VAAAGGVGALATLVRLGRTASFDAAGREALHGIASPPLTRLMVAASEGGGPLSLSLIAVALAIWAWRGGRARRAAMLALTLCGAGVLDTVLKAAMARPRPAPLHDYPLPSSASFPSGHALYSCAWFGAVALLLQLTVRTRRMRIALWCLAVGCVALVGASRVYLGVHHPSDVLAGYGVGVAWLTLVSLGFRWWELRRARVAPDRAELSPRSP